MAYPARIILVSRSDYQPALDELVEAFIRDHVRVVAVTGVDCRLVEDIIDELLVGNRSDNSRFILTTAHPDEPLEAVIDFVKCLNTEIGFEDRGIRLVDGGGGHDIDCRIDGIGQMQLKSEFVRKV